MFIIRCKLSLKLPLSDEFNVVGLDLRKPLSSRFKNFLKIAAKIPQQNSKKTKRGCIEL